MTEAATDPSERIAELERELQEANDTLDAIRNGEVDAIVVGGAAGQFVYTIENADRPYRVLVERMKEGAVTLNEAGLVLYANRSFAELVGRSTSELIGSRLFDHVVNTDLLQAMLSRGQSATAEVSLVNAAGTRIAVNLSVVELQVEDGAPRMLCSIVTDLTEMRRAEDALRQAQKMDAVGQLTGGIAHDFNNLLMAISSSLAMLQKRIPDDPQMHRLIDNALQGTQRGAALTQRMLAFARRQDLKPERVDIPMLARGMTELVQRTLGPAWSLQLRFSENLPPVLADANQLEMALLNLAVNARDAMPEGGIIQVTAQETAIEAGEMNGLATGRYIRLCVTDTGEGMDAETILRATEPFFTTKGVGKGTGLGLSMIHGLAKQLNGTFVLESALGEGTAASLWLPVADGGQTEPGKSDGAVGAASCSARLKVLAVDDEPLILMNIVALLEDMGHEVLEARSGTAALELARAHSDIELLITDQAMPDMTGTQLIQQLAIEFPDLPFILATGYGELPTALQYRIVKLGKPFNEQELANAVALAVSLTANSTADG